MLVVSHSPRFEDFLSGAVHSVVVVVDEQASHLSRRLAPLSERRME